MHPTQMFFDSIRTEARFVFTFDVYTRVDAVDRGQYVEDLSRQVVDSKTVVHLFWLFT